LFKSYTLYLIWGGGVGFVYLNLIWLMLKEQELFTATLRLVTESGCVRFYLIHSIQQDRLCHLLVLRWLGPIRPIPADMICICLIAGWFEVNTIYYFEHSWGLVSLIGEDWSCMPWYGPLMVHFDCYFFYRGNAFNGC